jgi:threonine/homoserine/homoserine lactone efflux protein
MLPFGSLFTQLPLLVIGVLYVLYLGFSVANKEKIVLSEEKKQQVQQIIEVDGSNNLVDYFSLAAM